MSEYKDMPYAEHVMKSLITELGWGYCKTLVFFKDNHHSNRKSNFYSLRGAIAKEIRRGRMKYVQGSKGMFPQIVKEIE